ncbi:hypothetical protein [Streptomyces sp. TLI_146]|uniref:hypothetical protein n=1 Tax=Streptomyces sp. TLI_146 TaxID=1938858 RepID=UPI000C71116C|nr:hypothetical protein [Streptomyces sp. TLI_146]PKV83505.1 hypothetical protein BX283_1010 [Streptomyces sp. TLI_146]
MDALDENAGGVVFVPADPQPYEFLRSVLVDRNRVRIVGEGGRTSALRAIGATPPLTFGLRRVTHDRPLSDGHWADLSGMLDASVTGRRWGCRTRVPSPAGGPTSEATVTLPCSPFQFGPTDGDYWSDVRQLTVDLIVRNDVMPWSVQSLFGMVDAFHMSRSAESDNDWAVYTVRCTAGAARRLQTYTNGYPYELRRDDRVRTVGWSTPVLGYRPDHGQVLQGLVASAVVCDAALSDQQVADTCRYLVNRYQIPM